MRGRFLRSGDATQFLRSGDARIWWVGVSRAIPAGTPAEWRRLRDALRNPGAYPLWGPGAGRVLMYARDLALCRNQLSGRPCYTVFSPHYSRPEDLVRLSVYEVPEFIARLEEALKPPVIPMFVTESAAL